MCALSERDGRVGKAVVADGAALSFFQDPPWLTARQDQRLRLKRFVVSGDVERVRFDRWDPETGDYIKETWTRDRTETIAGRLTSIFDPSWPAAVVQRRLGLSRVGLDAPSMWLGNYRGPADGPAVSQDISIRVAATAVPSTPVVQLSDVAQFSSHVVNLVVPDFGDRRLVDDFELRTVTRMFYEYFDDSYDILAIVPYDAHVDATAAYHARVRNDIEGLGLSLYDSSASFGSQGRLRGVEVYFSDGFGYNGLSNHEVAHTWSHDFDWARITGLPRTRAQTTSHGPLMSGGESYVSGVLDSTRRAVFRVDGTAVIERATAPARHHPLELYAMGLRGPSSLADFAYFEQQDQFASRTPAYGAAVAGGWKTASINDVMAAHGPRRGPVLHDLRRATIVVSRGGLIPASEMAMWNLLALRAEDPNRTGIIDYQGNASFDASTDGAIDLTTSIVPKDGAALRRTQDPEPPRFGATDCVGFEFTTPPPTRVKAGQRFTIAGRLIARDRSDFSSVLFRFWPSDDAADKVERADAEASRSGEFRTEVEIRPGREGRYAVEAFAFWPGAAPQLPRCRLSVLSVTP
jgi:hypothetical protein